MRLERCFGQYSPEVVSFRAPETIRTASEPEQFITPWEVVLFSRVGEEKDTETPNQTPEINQDVEPIRTSVNGDWEPFNTEPSFNDRFINLYGGPFSQQMELNRKNAERLLDVAAIEGKVILADKPMNRSRSIAGVNSDGSVTGRRRLFYGERIEDEDKSQSLVKSFPEGWRVEIPGQEILEELSRKGSEKPLNKRFASRFNQQLRQALSEIIIKEKLSAEKNPYFANNLLTSLLAPTIAAGWSAFGEFTLLEDISLIGPVLLSYGIVNFLARFLNDERCRSLRSFYEFLMPLIEIDRVARGLLFANLKGRNLVRLR